MRLLEHSWAPLSFSLWIVAKLLCSCLCVFVAINDLHAMDKKMFNIWKVKFYFISNKAYLIHDFAYEVEAFITLN